LWVFKEKLLKKMESHLLLPSRVPVGQPEAGEDVRQRRKVNLPYRKPFLDHCSSPAWKSLNSWHLQLHPKGVCLGMNQCQAYPLASQRM